MNHRAVLAETDLFMSSKLFILLTFVFLSPTQILDDVNTFGAVSTNHNFCVWPE